MITTGTAVESAVVIAIEDAAEADSAVGRDSRLEGIFQGNRAGRNRTTTTTTTTTRVEMIRIIGRVDTIGIRPKIVTGTKIHPHPNG